ncbi:MAG: hypothetical protein K2W96_07660, partial [Gemmataceae bacterium]|nr:hypothetical protein [Gemmataceae bacterium]
AARMRAGRGPASYESLVYACCQCNSVRKAAFLPIDPADGLARHLRVRRDGTIEALTLVGAGFIEICNLGRPVLMRFRRSILDVLAYLRAKGEPEADDLRRRYLAYPDDLPDLSGLRPPGGNSRPGGVAQSAFARRERGELPPTS